MEWLENLLFNPDSIAHIVLLYSLVISLGVLLGRVRIFGVSLGVTFILFVGILMGHFGFTGNLQIINFVQDFGLILFVFCIGLQVGPSFFSSFRKGGVSMNLMAAGAILLNIAVMVVLWLCLFEKEDLPTHVPDLFGQGLANGAVSGVHHIEIVAEVGLLLLDALAEHVHALAHAQGLGGDLDGAFLRYPDDGLDLGHGAQLVHGLADAAAPVQVFQCIDAGVEHDLIPDGLYGFQDLCRGLAFIPETAGIFHDQPLAPGGV